ncbi:L,D-transpeptidase [Streptomyces sp. NPDC001389]|uniref:L,D-transpeptidase n=1 Tax=unclassified Streptomyces TaxID=2593676 RepID=UPI00369653A4
MSITLSSRAARSAAAVLAAGSIVLLAGPAPGARAEEPAAAVAGGAPQDGAVQLRFDKNRKDPSDSRLYVIKGGSTVLAEFRAGSGTTTDECATGRGWLPDGTYTVGQHYEKYDGDLIKGYAIRLSDKKCANGTGRVRDQLFIHSEMNRDGSQGSTEQRRWTDSGPNDFRSKGCIKMRPEEIKKMFRLLERNGWPKTLRVVG